MEGSASVRFDISPVGRINTYDCVQGSHDANENIASWTSWIQQHYAQ
jgi:hypothetical protein